MTRLRDIINTRVRIGNASATVVGLCFDVPGGVVVDPPVMGITCWPVDAITPGKGR